jgi:hypothetical protein
VQEKSPLSTDYVIRSITRDQVDLAIEGAASEGWHPGLYDADSVIEQNTAAQQVGLTTHPTLI